MNLLFFLWHKIMKGGNSFVIKCATHHADAECAEKWYIHQKRLTKAHIFYKGAKQLPPCFLTITLALSKAKPTILLNGTCNCSFCKLITRIIKATAVWSVKTVTKRILWQVVLLFQRDSEWELHEILLPFCKWFCQQYFKVCQFRTAY